MRAKAGSIGKPHFTAEIADVLFSSLACYDLRVAGVS